MAGKRKGPTKMAAKKTVADKEKSDILNSSEMTDEYVLFTYLKNEQCFR